MNSTFVCKRSGPARPPSTRKCGRWAPQSRLRGIDRSSTPPSGCSKQAASASTPTTRAVRPTRRSPSPSMTSRPLGPETGAHITPRFYVEHVEAFWLRDSHIDDVSVTDVSGPAVTGVRQRRDGFAKGRVGISDRQPYFVAGKHGRSIRSGVPSCGTDRRQDSTPAGSSSGAPDESTGVGAGEPPDGDERPDPADDPPDPDDVLPDPAELLPDPAEF